MRTAPFHSVTVFGGSTIDRIATSHTPPIAGASNPGRLATAPGGVGFNLAVALAQLGTPARLVSRVGDDADGRHVVDVAGSAGVGTQFIGQSVGQPTASYLAVFDPSGNLVIGVAATDINDEITCEAVSDAVATAPSDDLWVIDANLPPDTLAFLTAQARASGRPIAAMPISPAKANRLAPILPEISYLFANRLETASLVDQDGQADPPLRELAQRLSERCRHCGLVVTDADKPLAAVNGGETRTFAPLPARVRNVSGAGDALAAATIHALSLRRPLFEALPYGLAAAAIAVESLAAIPPELTAAAIAARLDQVNRRAAS